MIQAIANKKKCLHLLELQHANGLLHHVNWSLEAFLWDQILGISLISETHFTRENIFK